MARSYHFHALFRQLRHRHLVAFVRVQQPFQPARLLPPQRLAPVVLLLLAFGQLHFVQFGFDPPPKRVHCMVKVPRQPGFLTEV